MPAVNHSANLAVSLVAVLRNHAPLAALVGARIFGGMAAQGSAMPRIIFHEISSNNDHQHDSATTEDPGIDETLIQFDCEARTLSAARAVTDAIAGVLNGAAPGGSPADLQGCFREPGGFAQPMDRDTGDGVAEAHRISVTYRILWRDA
ncbi:MAG: DUF3168 domain-containing protein [Verrucomicrobiota bacterium]